MRAADSSIWGRTLEPRNWFLGWLLAVALLAGTGRIPAISQTFLFGLSFVFGRCSIEIPSSTARPSTVYSCSSAGTSSTANPVD